jgi:hypothetical protein
VRRTCLHNRNGVRGPDDIMWPHPIKFGHELRVCFSDLPMCPAHLQNYTTRYFTYTEMYNSKLKSLPVDRSKANPSGGYPRATAHTSRVDKAPR